MDPTKLILETLTMSRNDRLGIAWCIKVAAAAALLAAASSVAFGGGRLTMSTLVPKTPAHRPIVDNPRANGATTGAGQERVDAATLHSFGFGFVPSAGGRVAGNAMVPKTQVYRPIAGNPHSNGIPSGPGEERIEGVTLHGFGFSIGPGGGRAASTVGGKDPPPPRGRQSTCEGRAGGRRGGADRFDAGPGAADCAAVVRG